MRDQRFDIEHDDVDEAPFGANAIRLSLRQWVIIAMIMVLCAVGIPGMWSHLEGWTLVEDYRVPSTLSDDYWVYEQFADTTRHPTDVIPMIGDSVIWGQYVKPDETLSHALNSLQSDIEFANLGVNGIHPVALSGLVEHYGDAFSDRKVILNYNPLWMTSPRRDLQIGKPMRFNHPRLVPQFLEKLPIYRESTVNRMSIAITHHIPLFQLNTHFRIAYFGQQDLPAWTMANPTRNPLSALSLEMPMPLNEAPSAPIPWMDKSEVLQNFSWVAPKDSLQWAYFKRAVETLQSRGNEVFVLFGPFNKHLLNDANRAEYQVYEDYMITWLEEQELAYAAPRPLASALYADASHPIPAGYEALAEMLIQTDSFQDFMDTK